MQNKIDSIFEERKEHSSKRVTLKPRTAEDFDIYYKLWTNDEVVKFISFPKKTEEELQKQFENILGYMEKKFTFGYTIFCNDAKKKIGSFGIHAISKISSRVDIGYLLLPEYWNKGIMSELVKMMLDYLFNEINLNKVCATAFMDNTASRKVLEKFGFQLEGVLKSHNYIEIKDKYYDDAKYRLLREDYAK
jgi:RimJ/RimL family protein N-acetyltransferase